MQHELITIMVITIVYMQLSVQWHDAEWYAVTHREVPCVRLSYGTEHLPEVFPGFVSPAKQNRPQPVPSTYFPSRYSLIMIHHTQKGGK